MGGRFQGQLGGFPQQEILVLYIIMNKYSPCFSGKFRGSLSSLRGPKTWRSLPPEHYKMVFFDAKEKVMLSDKRLVAIDNVEGTWSVRLNGAVEGDGQAGEGKVLPASQVQGQAWPHWEEEDDREESY